MRLAITLITLVGLCFPALAQRSARERMVIVISLDGFPAFALEDPKLPVPTLRRLIQNGAGARMTAVDPTVTWPNHTSMVTGLHPDRHGLLANGTISRTGAWPPVKVEPMLDKEKMVHAPTVYDAAHEAGLTTAQVDWVAINRAPTITWPFSEWASPDGPVEREMIQKGVISAADLDNFSKSNILFRDQVWTTAAVHLIREHKPNLLLVHFLSLDSVHHQFGPRTLAATSAIAFLDGCVNRIVEAVHDVGMTDRTTFLIVSDHGFKPYTKQVRPGVALAATGLTGKTFVLPEGGTAYLYLDRSQVAEVGPKAVEALKAVEGIGQIIGPDGFAALGLPQPDQDPQMYHFLLTARDGYSFSGATGGPVTAEVPQQRGSHGYLSSDPDMDAIFIASGYGVRPGVNLAKVENTSLAPTIAKLLGVSLHTATRTAIPLQ